MLGDFLLNLSTELIGIGLTVFIIDRILKHRESKKVESYRDKLCKRILDNAGQLFTFITILSNASAESIEELEKWIVGIRKQFMELQQIGEDVLTVEQKNQLVEMDRALELLIYDCKTYAGEMLPKTRWMETLDYTATELISLIKTIDENNFTTIGLEAWLEVMRESKNAQVDEND